MLLVRTKVKESNIHGLGLFADEFIPKGTKIWEFTGGFDIRFTKEEILALPKEAQIHLCKYGWKSKKSGLYCFCSDDGKYFNHSEKSNSISIYDEGEESINLALRDINKGEEITDDYSSFEDITDTENILSILADKYNLIDELDPRFK